MKSTSKLMLSLVCAGVLSACGSSDDAPTYKFSGTVSGLNGDLTVQAGDENVTVSGSGAINFVTEYESGDKVTASIVSAPDVQSCEITSASEFTFADADISGLTIACRDLALYVAMADEARSENGNSVTIDVLANDTSEYADEFEITAVSEPSHGSAEISEGKIVYTPELGFLGVDSFTYTATDGAQEDSAEVTVEVVQTLNIAGRVTDAPLAGATVTLTVGDKVFTATADESGNYELELEITDLADLRFPRLDAVGAGDEAYITLSSRLPNPSRLIQAAGEDGLLERNELSQVQVTQLTTAENFILETLSQDGSITADNIQMLQAELSAAQMLEIAAVIKLLADYPGYELPEGFETIAEFLNDSAAYNAFVQSANDAGDLELALQDTIADPEVMPVVDLESLTGSYVTLPETSRYNARMSDSGLTLADNKATFYEPISNYLAHSDYAQESDGSVSLQIDMSREMHTFWRWDANYFEEDLADIGIVLDAETLEAFKAHVQAEMYIDIFSVTQLTNLKVVHKGDVSLMALASSKSFTEEYNFSVDGVEYTIPSNFVGEEVQLVELLDVSNLGLAETIEVADNSAWIVPLPFDRDADMSSYYSMVYQSNQTQLVTLVKASETSGTWENVITGDTGEWFLNEDQTAITFHLNLDNKDFEIEMRYTRNEGGVTEVLSKITNTSITNSRPMYILAGGGAVERGGAAVEALLHGVNEFNLSMASVLPGQFTDTGVNYSSDDLSNLYGERYTDNGTLEVVSFAASEEGTGSWVAEAISDWSWEAGEEMLHIKHANLTAVGCVGEMKCGGQVLYPVSVNEETGVVTTVEMMLRAVPIYGDLMEGGVDQVVTPRISFWFQETLGEVEPTAAGRAQLSNYKQVLPWTNFAQSKLSKVEAVEQVLEQVKRKEAKLK